MHLNLVNITAGCIELTFQCFKEFDAVFPVRKHEETVSMFTRCKIQSLYCDKYQFKRRLESDLVEENKVEDMVEEETLLKAEEPLEYMVEKGQTKVEDTPPEVEESPDKFDEEGPAKGAHDVNMQKSEGLSSLMLTNSLPCSQTTTRLTCTALVMAIIKGNTDIALHLIDSGADMSIGRSSALFYASLHNQISVVEHILDKERILNIKNKNL